MWLVQLIVISHEGPDAREKQEDLGKMDEGYSIDHEVESWKLVTLFSALDFLQSQVTSVSFFVPTITHILKSMVSQFTTLNFFFNSFHLNTSCIDFMCKGRM